MTEVSCLAGRTSSERELLILAERPAGAFEAVPSTGRGECLELLLQEKELLKQVDRLLWFPRREVARN